MESWDGIFVVVFSEYSRTSIIQTNWVRKMKLYVKSHYIVLPQRTVFLCLVSDVRCLTLYNWLKVMHGVY